MRKFIFIILLFLSAKSFAFAPEHHLAEPQEQRARNLFLQIKCPVCQGQVIESSDAEAAYDLRKLIREKISEGKSDDEIKGYLVEKYGDDILNSPAFNFKNMFLWLLPIGFVVGGAIILYSSSRRKSGSS